MFISPPHCIRPQALLIGLLLVAPHGCASGDPAMVAGEVDVGVVDPDIPLVVPDVDTDADLGGDEVAVDPFESPCLNPGAWACECATAADCISGWCVPSISGSLCTEACEGECPEGWSCRTVVDASDDPVDLCVPLHVNLCRPCAAHSECGSVGDDAPACVERADGGGSFCGAPCSSAVLCPMGYVCDLEDGAEEEALGQCVPAGGDACECTARAIAEEATTTCKLTNEHGSCSGTRACGPEGLAACEGDFASSEVCDDIDNDCDGSLDEDLGTISCGVGACWTKAPVCIGGVEVSCVPKEPDPGAVELCDGLDNDCDGLFDEAFEPLNCGVGLCSTSVPACVKGEPNTCEPIFQPGEIAEFCNGVDDDCDGEIDEDFGGPGCS